MTPETLRYLREQRGLTREELAEFLGDCSASTVNKWERNMHAIPQWVEDKMLRSIPITLPLDELYLLINEAHKSNRSAASILGESIRLWLAQQQNESKFTSQTAADSKLFDAYSCIAASVDLLHHFADRVDEMEASARPRMVINHKIPTTFF